MIIDLELHRCLKVLEMPFAFKRLESLMSVSTLSEEAGIVKEAFATLEIRLEL